MEQNTTIRKNLEDYSIEELEVKKRICKERLDEVSEYSFWLRLSKKLGFDIYKLSFAIMFIGMGIFVAIVVITMIMSFVTSPEQMRDVIPMELFMKIMMIAFFFIMPFVFIISTEKRGPYKSRLKEINRILRIKKDVIKQSSKKATNGNSNNITDGDKNDIVELQDESIALEYKQSFIENPMKVVQGVCGLLNQQGGNLQIGVTKTKKAIGIEKDLEKYKNWDKYQLAVSDKIFAHLGKTIVDSIKIEQKETDGITICDIDVKFSSEPVWLEKNNTHHFLVRYTNSTRELKGNDAVNYINKHWKSKEEVIHKLQRFKEENKSNIQLVDKLIAGDVHYVPRDILSRKLKESKPQKYRYSNEDAKRIHDGGVWIPKENFSYDIALQVEGIGYLLDNEFVDQVKKYIDAGKSLNQQKDFVQNWILSRPHQLPNPDEAHNYYTRLDKAKEKCEEIDKLIDRELKKSK